MSESEEQYIRRADIECYSCVYANPDSGVAHIACGKPDKNMKGNELGIRRGLFNYPYNFDPTWKTKLCDNFGNKI